MDFNSTTEMATVWNPLGTDFVHGRSGERLRTKKGIFCLTLDKFVLFHTFWPSKRAGRDGKLEHGVDEATKRLDLGSGLVNNHGRLFGLAMRKRVVLCSVLPAGVVPLSVHR